MPDEPGRGHGTDVGAAVGVGGGDEDDWGLETR